MAYTIKLHDDDSTQAKRIRLVLQSVIEKDGRFSADIELGDQLKLESYQGSRKHGFSLIIRRVRLTEAKPYCGQHAGPCLINPFTGPQPKKRMKLLEWDDWVEFNNLVNDVLDHEYPDADVWSTPFDVKGKMWIRKGTRRRQRYDYTESYESDWSRTTGLPQFIWDQGTDKQFETT